MSEQEQQPPGPSPYSVPADQKHTLNVHEGAHPHATHYGVAQDGDRLEDLAARHHISQRQLRKLNQGVRHDRDVRPGTAYAVAAPQGKGFIARGASRVAHRGASGTTKVMLGISKVQDGTNQAIRDRTDSEFLHKTVDAFEELESTVNPAVVQRANALADGVDKRTNGHDHDEKPEAGTA